MIQRQKFKVSRLQNRTRLEVYPDLLTNDRKYNGKTFNPDRAYQRLANYSFVRKVSSCRQISIYGQTYYLPKQYRQTYVHLRFDPEKISWQIFNEQNKFIKAYKAINLMPRNIRNLSVGQRTI